VRSVPPLRFSEVCCLSESIPNLLFFFLLVVGIERADVGAQLWVVFSDDLVGFGPEWFSLQGFGGKVFLS
jgi:hypothetical protein